MVKRAQRSIAFRSLPPQWPRKQRCDGDAPASRRDQSTSRYCVTNGADTARQPIM